MREARPRIKLKLSRVDKTLEVTSKILLFVMWSLTLYIFFRLPTTIPTHWNASGNVDAQGNKMTVLILPILATIIYFGLTQLSKHPHILNYMNEINEENAHKQYTIATRMLRFIKLATLVIFSVIILFTYLTAIEITNGLGVWFLPLTSALILIPIIVSILQSSKKTA